MRSFKLFVLVGLLVSIKMDVSAQKEKQKIKTQKTTSDTLPIQPPKYSPPGIIMDTVKPEDLDKKIGVFDQFKIDFDTTEVPQDSFTLLIKKLLVVTKAKETDLETAEKSLKESMAMALDNPSTSDMMHKFQERFMFEMREGRASRWMENLYIRNYRTLFTPEEIQTLIDFYQTPAGQKTLARTKILLQNVMSEARKIGAYLGADIMKKLISDENK
jgi:hypothetical protein